MVILGPIIPLSDPNTRNKGFTLVELAIAAAIMGVIALVIANVFLKSSQIVTDTDQRTRTDSALRAAMDKVETTLLNANYFDVALTTEVIFRTDSNTDSNYQPYGDIDGDGIFNLNDPDDDNDATQIQPSSAQWRIGYDMKDDDEDGDNQIDMRWRIRLSTAQKILYRDYSRNGEPWGSHEETLLTHVVSTPVFTFYGSRNTLLCQTCGTTDTNNDGIITAAEIDTVANGGNGNGKINGSTETAKIVTIEVYLDKDDEDMDTKFDSHLSVEVIPPPLYLKRRQ